MATPIEAAVLGHPPAAAAASATKATGADTDRHHAWVAGSVLAVLAAVLVFARLGQGPLEVYDEGLYGMHAQNALRHGVWLHAVDANGAFPTGAIKFSKPPLPIWLTAASFRALGAPSLLALRLPFALASFVIAGLLFAWGRLIEPGARGVWLGFTWAGLWLCSNGAHHFGRTATIEPLLLAFVVLALYAHARSWRAPAAPALAWCALAGLAIAGAFFTKQLVCALAALPILVIELLNMRREGWRLPLARMLVALGLPFVLASAWLIALWQRVGDDARRVLWSHAVLKRLRGFDGLHHRNYLNRISEQLDLDAAPWSWELGLIGLIWLLANRARTRDQPKDAWLIAGVFACGVIAFDLVARSILPWYALTMLPALAFGNAWLITRAFAAATQPGRLSRGEALAATAGAFALLVSVANATRALLPSIAVVAVGALALLGCARGAVQSARLHASLLALLAGGLLATGALARDGYRHSETDPLAVLGMALAGTAVQRVTVDPDVEVHDYALATFFGPKAARGSAPWLGGPTAPPHPVPSVDAHVDARTLPRELSAAKDQRFVRAAGLFAVVGDLSHAPFVRDDLTRLLARAPLTFEAEELVSERFDTWTEQATASGGAVRRFAQGSSARPTPFVLASGLTPDLPRGSYVARFWLSLRCKGFRGEWLGNIEVRTGGDVLAERTLDCSELAAGTDSEAYTPWQLALQAPRAMPLRFTVRYEQGAISLDRIDLARVSAR